MPPTDILVRPATPHDLAAINDIYNYYVLNSTCTYQEVPVTPDERRTWFEGHGLRHPVTVAMQDGLVVGWGCLSRFRDRSAYDRTCENAVYVRDGLHRRGIGAALLADLIARAAALGYHTIIAGIDAEQTASIAFHARFGFVTVAHFREVGYKFGRWLDVVFMQLMLSRT
jgi:phosphinothricin acetyltransferase